MGICNEQAGINGRVGRQTDGPPELLPFCRPVGFADIGSGASVVDLGCGAGEDVILAAQRVGALGRVFGIDRDPVKIGQASQAVREAGQGVDCTITLKVADIGLLPHPKTYADILVSNGVSHLCPDKEKLFRNVFRILRPGGCLVFSTIVGGLDVNSVNENVLPGIEPEARYFSLLTGMSFIDVRVLARQPLTNDGSGKSVVVFSALKPPLNC